MPKQPRDQTALVQLKIRMREPLRARLEEEASLRGVSINAEVVDRLEHTFQRNDLLAEVLSLTFGDRLAGLLIMIGMAMAGAAAIAPPNQGRRLLFQDDWWASDPSTYETAAFAAKILLDSGRPKGRTSTTIDEASLALQFVEGLVDAVNAKKRDQRHENILGRGPLTDAMVRLMGPIATRMGEAVPKMRERRELLHELIKDHTSDPVSRKKAKGASG
jgi:hypothetical protein